MIYLTVRNTSGGNHGHQLKDLIGGITIAKVFGFEYVHTYYPYLEFFGLGYGEKKVDELPEDLDYIKIGGPFWNGISSENLHKIFDPLIEKYPNRDCLISIENALRLFPFQAGSPILEEMIKDISQKFEKKNGNRPTYFDPEKINIAVHINRGQDYDKEKFPELFDQSTTVRFMFPISYWENIISQIKENLEPGTFLIHIYTEKLNSEEIIETFKDREYINLYIGDNRADGNNQQIHDIFYHFVKADLLVCSNSSFSTMATYFRDNKLTIYHPHDHLKNLPENYFIPTDSEGNFDTSRLKDLIPT